MIAYGQDYYPNDSTICLSKNRFANILLTGNMYKDRFELYKEKSDTLTIILNSFEKELTLTNNKFNLCNSSRVELESIVKLKDYHIKDLNTIIDKNQKDLNTTRLVGASLIIVLLTIIIAK